MPAQHTNITQLLESKGLLGYIDGSLPKPGPRSVPLPTDTSTIPTTPIYLGSPTLDEWNFRDQLTRGHIIVNRM